MSAHVRFPMKPATAPARALTPAPFGTLQRQCGCGGSGSSGDECEGCKKNRRQRKAAGSRPDTAPLIVHDVLRSPGQPLDAQTRAFFEPRFGHDFSKVRIHTDARANESAHSVNAMAYTVGPQIVFGAGLYQPGAASGRRLLAHELTHVIQQRGQSPTGHSLRVGPRTDSYEQEAERASSAAPNADAFHSAEHALGLVQRQVMDSTDVSGQTLQLDSTPSDAAPGACVTREDIPDNVSPVVNRSGQIRQTFEMNVDWSNTPPEARKPGTSYCDCMCGEYRQYVKGHLIINGTPEKSPLWGGAVLEEDVYHEDGPARYGHRNETTAANEKFIPDRASGCSYRGNDAPGVFIGDDIDVLFHFKGQTYDSCNQVFGKAHEWEFKFKGKLNYGP